MAKSSSTQTSGGKGNIGMFIERDRKIYAAGVPTAQPDQSIKDRLEYCSLQNKVNAFIGDAMVPESKNSKLPPLQHPKKRDMRNAGIFSEGAQLLNPPVKTKFQTLVEDFKNTAYNSYWNREVGKIPDPIPTLPEGFRIDDTSLGKKTPCHGNLYGIIMPTHSVPDKTPVSKNCGYQMNRNYCSFNPNATFGNKSNADRSGKVMKCCLQDANIYMGTALRRPITKTQAKFQNASMYRLGVPQTPNNNTKCVSEGFTFGKLKHPDNLPECLRECEINPYKDHIKECLGHLNTLRKCLSKRFDENFFHKFYLSLKYLDKSNSDWLEKDLIYNQCNAKYIRFNPHFIEPLLSMWHAFDGSQIEYKIFICVINHKEPCPEIPKIKDMMEECIDYRTTYNEMVKENLCFDKNEFMAGAPSGSYFERGFPVTPDGYCKADRFYFPQESDMRVCLCPSIFTLVGVSHRDMYTKRDPQTIKKVFECAGETFEDKQFEIIWEMAKKNHSQEWVCFETFRRSMDEYKKDRKSRKH